MKLVSRRIPELISSQPLVKSGTAWLKRLEADAPGAEGRMSTQDNQSYLAKLSPWTGRAPTPKPQPQPDPDTASGDLGLKQSKGNDHRVTHRHRLSLRNYPADCPPLLAQWFFATDVPKRRPSPLEGSTADADKPRPAPRKYAPFSKTDSKAIEAAFQKIAEEEDASEQQDADNDRDGGQPSQSTSAPRKLSGKPNSSLEADEHRLSPGSITVPVNEDYLFDVDVERRELAPAYWLGPVYEVRRGTWFYQESTVQRPCDENLAAQLEDGFLKLHPWREVKGQEAPPERAEREIARSASRSASQPRSRPISQILTTDAVNALKTAAASTPVSPKASSFNLAEQAAKTPAESKAEQTEAIHHARTLRLFGPHSNSVVTYQDATTAWILTDDFISRMSSTMYKRFAGGGHFAGVKVTRGYVVQAKKIEDRDARPDQAPGKAAEKGAAGDSNVDENAEGAVQENPVSTSESRRLTLERQMSSLVSSVTQGDREKEEEEIRKRDEKEIQDDYRDQDGEERNREIEHLLLVTHGIGQRLGLRMESVNFVHDVNTFRKTLKAVYNESPDLQALNSEVDKLPKNCRIQVLPINWRHKLDFPKQSLKHNRKEHDLGDAGFGEEEDYPNLDDISVEGVPAVRNLITDLALDILLYQSPAYKDHIARIVLEECNRIFKLFKERNPSFHGKVSMVGHSLGSAVMFDILCMQGKGSDKPIRRGGHHMKLDFEVEDFYALGSPVGLFQMLKGRTVAARHAPSLKSHNSDSSSDGFLDPTPINSAKLSDTMGTSSSEILVSSPLCRQLFNIFHPTDPISYRIEPLISPAMASLKPQPLPYTKRGIFGSQVGQGLTGIGARVGQSVSGLWSSFSSGIASSLLNRSLGFTADDASRLGGPSGSNQSRTPLSLGATNNTNLGTGAIPTAPAAVKIETLDSADRKAPARDEPRPGEPGQHPPTLIDSELETLYSGFQNGRKSAQAEDAQNMAQNAEWAEAEERGRKIRKEEAKVRALNLNGRVDYSIQE